MTAVPTTTTVHLDWRGEEALEAYRVARRRLEIAEGFVADANAALDQTWFDLVEHFHPDADEYVVRNEVVARRFSEYGVWIVDPSD